MDDAQDGSGWRVMEANGQLAYPELLDTLAAKVHAAWMTEKQRQGWADHVFVPRGWGACAVEDCGQSVSGHMESMKPWADLRDDMREGTRFIVRAVLAALIEEDTP